MDLQGLEAALQRAPFQAAAFRRTVAVELAAVTLKKGGAMDEGLAIHDLHL